MNLVVIHLRDTRIKFGCKPFTVGLFCRNTCDPGSKRPCRWRYIDWQAPEQGMQSAVHCNLTCAQCRAILLSSVHASSGMSYLAQKHLSYKASNIHTQTSAHGGLYLHDFDKMQRQTHKLYAVLVCCSKKNWMTNAPITGSSPPLHTKYWLCNVLKILSAICLFPYV